MNAPSGVNEFARLCWWVVLWASLVIGVFILLTFPLMAADLPPKAEATVLIKSKGSAGSGFHIGDGYIVTAAHVVANHKPVTVVSSNDTERPAKLLFFDSVNDIAILRVTSHEDLSEVDLACRAAVRGETVELRGHPNMLTFISTWGHIAGSPRPIGDGGPKLPVNIITAKGASGGPMLDESGKVIGVLVAFSLQPIHGPLGALAPPIAMVPYISWAVPSLTVCAARDLLGLA